jgi:hypothetical protein
MFQQNGFLALEDLWRLNGAGREQPVESTPAAAPSPDPRGRRTGGSAAKCRQPPDALGAR